MLEEINYEELDPGIREIVRRLRELGWDTTDSGDGASKPDMECAMPFANVAIATSVKGMTLGARALMRDLDTISTSTRSSPAWSRRQRRSTTRRRARGE